MTRASSLWCAALLVLLGARAAAWAQAEPSSAASELVVVPTPDARACGGATAELLRELEAAGFAPHVLPNARDVERAFAVVVFDDDGTKVRVLVSPGPSGREELAVLAVDCRERLVRRRLWTLVSEMLWAHRQTRPAVDAAPPPPPEPPSAGAPLSEAQPLVAATNLREAEASPIYFGAAPLVTTSPIALASTLGVALLGGRRFKGGYRLGGRVSWPLTGATNDTVIGRTRLWTFSGDIEASSVMGRFHSLVAPYVGLTLGLDFTLLDASDGSAWAGRRWGAVHAHALAHLGLLVRLARYAPFAQVEIGGAHRLDAATPVRALERGMRVMMVSAAIGILFDY